MTPGYYLVRCHVTQYEDGVATVECLDLIEALRLPVKLALALKYLWRAGRKTRNRTSDLQKAGYCIWRELNDGHKQQTRSLPPWSPMEEAPLESSEGGGEC